MNSAEDIEALLKLDTVAILGCSPKPDRPSHHVAAYLLEAGYRVVPVHPGVEQVLGEKCYAELKDVPEKIELVVVFRKSEHALDAVRQTVAIGAKGVWLQDGIESQEAAELARKNGLRFVSNDCIMRQHLSRFGR